MTDFTGHLHIHDRDLDDLLAALRRHYGPNAVRLLEVWSTSECEIDDQVAYFEEDDWWPVRFLDDELTAWAHREISAHVAGGRFEHALCLLEKYRRPLTPEDMAARLGHATAPQETA